MNPPIENYVISDTTAPLSLFAKNGYYQVGNKIFNHKIYALQEATRTGFPVNWNFNDSVFNKFNWTTPQNVPILEMYRMRAQQLRIKYKWLICCWSGGADSTTILESFLDNNIHLDEVLVLWPISQSQGKYKAVFNTTNLNMMSEWDLTIEPAIRRLQKQYPKLLITIVDTLAELPKCEDSEDTVRISEKTSYATIQKYRALDQIMKKRFEDHSDVAMITGVNPVTPAIIDNVLAMTFNDTLTNPTSKSDVTLEGWTRNVEFFYWSPDLPELIREQAHIVLKYINQFPKTRALLPRYTMKNGQTILPVHRPDSEDLRQFLKGLLYPNYPLTTFQVRKATNFHTSNEWEAWFFTNPHAEEFLIPWRSCLASHDRLIKEEFKTRVNGEIVSYKVLSSKWHYVGKLIQVENNLG
jgi:hypothetical protein